MKKIITISTLSFLFAGVLGATVIKTPIDTNKYGEILEKHELKIQEINNLRIKTIENECEINKLKKALAKIISKDKEYCTDDCKSKSKMTHETKRYKEINVGNSSKKCDAAKQDCKIVSIADSYKDFAEEKTFKVKRSDAFLYKYPSLKATSTGSLKKGVEFKSKRYTKAGWVETSDGLWVKGYTLSPSILNETSKEDTKKWNKECIKTKEI